MRDRRGVPECDRLAELGRVAVGVDDLRQERRGVRVAGELEAVALVDAGGLVEEAVVDDLQLGEPRPAGRQSSMRRKPPLVVARTSVVGRRTLADRNVRVIVIHAPGRRARSTCAIVPYSFSAPAAMPWMNDR